MLLFGLVLLDLDMELPGFGPGTDRFGFGRAERGFGRYEFGPVRAEFRNC